MKIKIGKQNVELKMTLRSLMIYEQIYGKSFTPNGLTEVLVYFYSTILASKPDINLTFDAFIDMTDKNPDLIQQFSSWLVKATEKNNYIANIQNSAENESDPNV